MSTDRNAFPYVAVGGGVALAALWYARSRSARASALGATVERSAIGTAPANGWVFPIPSLGDRVAEVSDGFDSPRTYPDGSKHKHLGVDLMFRRRSARDLIAVYAPGSPNGTKGYFMPDGIPALAASAGVVRFAQTTIAGFTVILQHPSGWATFYTHMSSLAVAKGDEVVAGQPLGIIGASPLDGEHIKHLHFELWKDGTRGGAVDPQAYVEAWPHMTIADWQPGASIAIARRDGPARSLRGAKNDGPFAHFVAKTYDDLWRAQRDYLAQLRGYDQPEPPPGMGLRGLKIPRTTNADVLQLADYWGKELAKAKQVMGYKAAVEKWRTAMIDVDRYAKTGEPDEMYPKNNELWHTLSDVSIQIAIGDEAPSKWDMAVDSLKYSVTHLPDTLEHAAQKSVDFVADAAHAAGHIVNEAGKGLFGGLGTPLLSGGGLLGVYLLTRSRGREDAP
jgi:hypothetical protein